MGQAVCYTLSAEDAQRINLRRTTPSSIQARTEQRLWPLGAQAHVGAEARAGDRVPLFVISTGQGYVTGQALLDGTDQLWVRDAPFGEGNGRWTWIGEALAQ